MADYRSLSHTLWDCKYHLVWIPKYRKKKLFSELRKYLGDVFHELASQKESKIEEGHLMSDHVPYVALNTAKILGCSSCRVHKGKKRYSYCPQLRRKAEELYWATFLGARLLRFKPLVEMKQPYENTSKSRRGGGPEDRPTATVRRGTPPLGGTQLIRFERFKYYKPPALPEVYDMCSGRWGSYTQ